jgi:hypothetical protein
VSLTVVLGPDLNFDCFGVSGLSSAVRAAGGCESVVGDSFCGAGGSTSTGATLAASADAGLSCSILIFFLTHRDGLMLRVV